MSIKRTVLGFGFQPEESHHHFVTVQKTTRVVIYERFDWQGGVALQPALPENAYVRGTEKAEISLHKWMLLEESVQAEFNGRLKKQKLPAGRFVIGGQTSLERLLGKELLVLVWALEECDFTIVPIALRNWLGLSPEERWWLYTMTNAATGNIDDRSGWRKALRYALAEK